MKHTIKGAVIGAGTGDYEFQMSGALIEQMRFAAVACKFKRGEHFEDGGRQYVVTESGNVYKRVDR
jgi:hypothetical protein